ncbi:MAG: hypothetical protein Q6363_000690 [Candidatus Njordarchaeota archaeon]
MVDSISSSDYRKMTSKLNDHIKTRDKASNIKAILKSKIEEVEEESTQEKVEELNKIVEDAKNTLAELERHIGMIEDAIKKERAVLETLRTLIFVRKISVVLGGFLLFFGGVMLTFSILLVTNIVSLPLIPSTQMFIGILWLFTSILIVFSGAMHQAV